MFTDKTNIRKMKSLVVGAIILLMACNNNDSKDAVEKADSANKAKADTTCKVNVYIAAAELALVASA